MQEVHFVTHPELWTIIGVGTTIAGIVIGVIMSLLHKSNKASILEQAEKINEKYNSDLLKTKEEMNEIKNNYLSRFDEIKAINQEILIVLEKIKTEIDYIKQK